MDLDFLKAHPNHKAGFVNIIGKPNVGKSTLMNELVGERLAIITSKAQTTRHRILGIVNGENFQIVYSDTPGIIDPAYKMQESMMKFVASTFKDADVFLAMAEIGEKNAEMFASRLKKVKAPVIFLINKIDLAKKGQVEAAVEFWQNALDVHKIIPISALNKVNLGEVFDSILELLPLSPPYYPKDELTDRPERFFVSEIIREKILLNYKQEIPYSVEVVIEAFKDEPEIARIRALILANRRSQKPILIGKGGSMLKKVGTEARKDIEQFLDKKVFLELYVKVKDNWRDNELLLKNLGYR